MKLSGTLLGIILCITAVALFFIGPSAQAQSPKWGSWTTNTTISVASSNTLSINSAPQYVRKTQGMAIMPAFAGTNTGTANVAFTFAVSPDGTNYNSTSDFTLTVAMNGTNAIIGYTNWPALYLDNVRYIRLKSIYNYHTNNVFVSNIWYSYWP